MKPTTKDLTKTLLREGKIIKSEHKLINGYRVSNHLVEAFGHRWLIEDYESNKPKITQLED